MHSAGEKRGLGGILDDILAERKMYGFDVENGLGGGLLR